MKEITMQKVKISDITIGENFRKSMNKDMLKELTANVKQHGVIEPIILRRLDNKELLLVAGARRITAAGEAGLKEIPARIMEMTDEEANTTQAIENLHRENLNPIDEAEQFQKLMASKGEKEVAALVNKTAKYVARSLALLDLDKDIKEMVRTGKIAPAHGHLMLRVPEKQRENAVAHLKGNVGRYGNLQYPVCSFREYIDNLVGVNLESAQFDTAACQACSHYGKNHEMLFDDPNKGLCDNRECFTNKTAEYHKQLADKAAERGFKGLKYLGAKGPRPNYMMSGHPRLVGRGLVVEEKWATDKMLALRKSNPEKFGYIIDTANNNRPTLVLLDKSLVIKAEQRGSNGGQPSYDWEKQSFIGEARQAVIDKALSGLKLDGKTTMFFLREYLKQELQNSECIRTVTGKDPEKFSDKDIEKLPIEQMALLVWLDNHMSSDRRIEALKPLFPKLGDEAKAAMKDAEAKWPAELQRLRDEAAAKAKKEQEEAAAAKAKKGGTKKGAKKEEEEPEDDGAGDEE